MMLFSNKFARSRRRMTFLTYQTRDGAVNAHIRTHMKNIDAEEVLRYGFTYDIVVDPATGDRWPRSRDRSGRKPAITFEALTGGRTKSVLKRPSEDNGNQASIGVFRFTRARTRTLFLCTPPHGIATLALLRR